MARVTMQANPAEMKGGAILFEKGTYLFKCVDVVDTDKDGNVKLTGDGKRQRFDLELVVAKGPWAGRGRVFHNGTIIEAGAPGHGMALSCFHAFGIWDPETPGELDVELQDMKGRYVLADADVEPPRTVAGKTYDAKMKIKRWHALTEEELAREMVGAIDPEGGTEFNPPAKEPAAPAPSPRPAPAPAATATRTAPPPARPAAGGKLPWKK